MAEAIRMPLLSDTMTEGVIAEWHKKVGDLVKADDVIADVETDKATMEVMPYVEGTLLYVGVEKGKAAKVNQIIAIIGKQGEDYSALLDESPTNAPTPANTDTTANEAPAVASNQASDSTTAAPAELPKGVSVVRMPLLSDTMTEGKIVAWSKQVGDTVKSDDVMAEVETDKATMEVMPYADGTLLHIGVEAGSAAKVNDIIAIIGPAGTDISGILAAEKASTTNAPKATSEASTPTTTTNQTTTPASPTTPNQTDGGDARSKISPLAKRLAQEKGIDINQVVGSGDNGRIVKRDIENFQPTAQTASPTVNVGNSASAQTAIGQESYTDTPVSQMRKIIAKRLGESKFTAPHFYLTMSIKMDNAMASRKAINEVATAKVSFNDLVIKAAAMALRKHPEVNTSWLGDVIRTNHHIHIGTAVAVEEGLLVPVVRFADQKSLSQIAADSAELIGKARNKKLQPHEFTGNTFTISNLGMMDIDEFTAIINPPDAAILAVGKIEPTPVVENGDIVVRHIMKVTLSCDHRVVDGAVGSRFLQTLKAYLENPVTMLA